MIALALDTASDRCTVAIQHGNAIAQRHVDGARNHAREILGLIDAALGDVSASVRDVTDLIVADGPGSFTGLRVAAAVTKALAWRRDIACWSAASLLARAFSHAPSARTSRVIAASDALRGEVYAACWEISDRDVTLVGDPPRAYAIADLARMPRPDVLVLAGPAALVERTEAATGASAITGERALPDATALLALQKRPGAVHRIPDIAAWEPDYGRPAEAQAVWERKHGRALPAVGSVIR